MNFETLVVKNGFLVVITKFNFLLKIIYALLISGFLIIKTTQAQIVYTDVIPDDTVSCSGPSSCTDTLNLDLNNDGNIDFILAKSYLLNICYDRWGRPTSSKFDLKAKVNSVNSNSFFSIDGIMPSALNFGTSIDSNLVWMSGVGYLEHIFRNFCSVSSPTYSGYWYSASDKYLPLKLSISGNHYYGWVRMHIEGNGFSLIMTVKDYAYNTIPYQSILAGDTSSATSRIIQPNFNNDLFFIYPNPASNVITINFSYNDEGTLQIVNSIGQILFSEKINSEQRQIDVTKFTSGVYVAKWTCGDYNESNTFSIIK